MTPTKATVVDGGENCKPVNNYADIESRIDFDNNPPLPLIPPRPDLDGQVVEVVEVWQWYNDIDSKWETITHDELISYSDWEEYAQKGDIETRKAYQLVEAEKENPECPRCGFSYDSSDHRQDCIDNTATTPILKGSEESAEKAALLEYPVPIGHPNALMRPLRVSERKAFIKGANWQKQQCNEEVVAIVEAEKTDMSDVSTTPMSDYYHEQGKRMVIETETISIADVRKRFSKAINIMESKIGKGGKLEDTVARATIHLLNIMLEDLTTITKTP